MSISMLDRSTSRTERRTQTARLLKEAAEASATQREHLLEQVIVLSLIHI